MNDREALPDIDIAAGQDRLTFVKRMVSIAESESGVTVELHQDTFGNEGLHFANFLLPGFSENIRSGGQLIVRPGEARILIEMRSADWQTDHPTRNEYIAFCKEVFGPLLRAYNKAFGTHYRMRVSRPRADYQLPPQSKRLFERFSILANTRTLHPLDWERFYLFVRNSRKELPEGALRPLLIQKGFSSEMAQMLSELYYHLWRFKRLKF
ncbi:hypothetical protein [Shinella zoogloeoides]|uniref:hypothetical protein n=1 Tax=Shinella zoogloeoides TaxID=352475 RepID=UPI00299E345D|nr:hypothetical protein [Shinella zoogloeoides]WPE22665.1 hypothetical protein ShzoTeo12_38820 [Shinella zoogloeoides]